MEQSSTSIHRLLCVTVWETRLQQDIYGRHQYRRRNIPMPRFDTWCPDRLRQ
nr:MAG TPA_asm: hypothetical protein [Caudoviricetes sp.]